MNHSLGARITYLGGWAYLEVKFNLGTIGGAANGGDDGTLQATLLEAAGAQFDVQAISTASIGATLMDEIPIDGAEIAFGSCECGRGGSR